MITIQKHEISANVKDRYANIVYCFHFENMNNNRSNELKFEMTVDPNAFISKFTASIDGEQFVGQTKEKKTASKEYNVAKKKNENAILIDQPNKDIPNLFRIKTNIDAKSKVILNISIEQYLQKKFNFNEFNVQLLRSFSKYNIQENFDHIAFKLNIEEISGIYDVNIPMINNSDIIIDEQIMDKRNQKCQISGKITTKSSKNDVVQDDEWRKTLKIKDQIDVKDRGGWYLSEVIDVTAEKVKIHYYGYDIKYDTFLDVDSERLAMPHTKTANTNTNELTLKYKVKGEAADSHILFDNKSGTFCHIISDVITDSMLMDEGQDILIPRRVMFVIDKSGSMGGSKWLKTISSTIMAIKQLRNGYDRFGIILFNNKKEMQILPSKHIRGCILANDENINDSVNALQNETAGGGTNINDALLKAIELIKIDILLLNNDDNVQHNFFMNQVIFITDGEATHGETDTNKILTNVKNANDLSKIDKYNNKICIFSFGVGKDTNDSGWTQGLNHSFLKLLSVNNNGFYSRIKKTSADTELGEYFHILATPILSNINVEYKNKNICELTNTHFHTLYSGNDLIICGKIGTKQDMNDYKLSLVISAVTGKEVKQNDKLITKPINISKQLTININSETVNVESTERIWAYLKLKQFATQKLIHNDMIEIDEDEKKEDESLPLSLALKYKFVTPWTSMIVVKQKTEDEMKQQPAVPVNDVEDDVQNILNVQTLTNTCISRSLNFDRFSSISRGMNCISSDDCDDDDGDDCDNECVVVKKSQMFRCKSSKKWNQEELDQAQQDMQKQLAQLMVSHQALEEADPIDDVNDDDGSDSSDADECAAYKSRSKQSQMFRYKSSMKWNQAQVAEVQQDMQKQLAQLMVSHQKQNSKEKLLSDALQKRIRKELKDLESDASCNYSAVPMDDDIRIWNATILGPVDSAYDGGVFKLKIQIPMDYPLQAPKCTFITKIYHCNVDANGIINLDILRDNWSPAWTIKKLLLAIIKLLTEPNVDDSLVQDIAKLYEENRKKHDKIAKEWTQKYAK